MYRTAMLALMTTVAASLLTFAAEPAPAPADTLIVIDSAGKEQKLKTWSYVVGTVPLSWITAGKTEEKKDDKKDEKKEGKKEEKPARKAPTGPPALAFREGTKFHFADGVLALVPVTQIRSIDFDNEAETMTVHVATSDKPDDDVVLTGSTAFKGINKLTLEAEVERGDAVISLTFRGGVPKGIRGVRFPEPKVIATPKGRPAVVQSADGMLKRGFAVTDLAAYYRTESSGDQLLPTVMFKKTLKVDLKDVSKLTHAEEDSAELVFNVTRKDAEELPLTLLTDSSLGKLLGFVGRVPSGYRLFPVKRVTGITFDTSEVAEPKEKEKEKEKEKKEKN
jgi:hypothetical protein